MKDAVLITTVAIALLNIATTLFSLSGQPLKDEKNLNSKRLTKLGKTHLILSLILVILPIIQKYYQDSIDKGKEAINKIEQDKRDSTLRADYDLSYKKTTLVLSKTLGKYGFKLDSSNKILTRLIKDSSKTKIIQSNDPVLQLANEGLGVKGLNYLKQENDYYVYKLTFVSVDQGSSYFDLKVDICVEDSVKGLTSILKPKTLEPKDRLSILGIKFFTFHVSNDLKFNSLYVYIRGSYKNPDGSKTFSIDEIYYNKKNSNEFGGVIGKTYEAIKNIATKGEL